jgi:hypothetical protein
VDPVQGNLAIQLHSGSVLYSFSLRHSDLDNGAYQPARAFYECKFACEQLGSGRLNLIQLFAKVFQEDLLKASTELYRFFSDEFKTLIDFG